MDETATEQQQLAELQAKVEGLRTTSATSTQQEVDPVVSSAQTLTAGLATPIDLEKTPEFEIWKQTKLRECLDYLRGNWQMEIAIEQLLMQDEYLGFPDPRNRRSHTRTTSNNNYIDPATGAVAVNPATGRPMSYAIWRKIDPPAPGLEAIQ